MIARSLCKILFLGLLTSANLTVVASEKTQVYFSPQDQLDQRLIGLIEKETKSIRAAVYCLTHRGIAKALIDAKNRGVAVDLVVDPFSVKTHTPLKRMSDHGVILHVWSADAQGKEGRKRKPLMHDKFCIFGDHTVWTGSFNFTKEASESNRENVVVIRDADLVDLYVKEFDRIKDLGSVRYERFLKVTKGEPAPEQGIAKSPKKNLKKPSP